MIKKYVSGLMMGVWISTTNDGLVALGGGIALAVVGLFLSNCE